MGSPGLAGEEGEGSLPFPTSPACAKDSAEPRLQSPFSAYRSGCLGSP